MSDAAGRSAGPVYVAGLDRSGKTTMSAILSSHPDLAIPGVGSNMWTYFHRRYGDLARPANFERCLAAMLRYKHVRYLEPDPDRIRREFRAGEPSYARLFALFLIHYAQRRGKPRWGAQTGLVERYAHELFAAYPDLRIVHLLRDPRDRYEASLSRWPDGRGRAGGAVARWRYSTSLARRHVADHPGRYLVVRFEDLVREPEATVREVCDFLGLRYLPAMLEMGEAPTLVAKMVAGGGDPQASLFSTTQLGRYRGRVPEAELAFIQRHAGALMQAYGYEADALGWTPAERLRFALVDQPDQLARLAAWRLVEELQQRFPRVVPRRPGNRMLVDEPLPAAVTGGAPADRVAAP
ncbi:sulfotransferase [Egicoccus sp. AB-alg2]|uniref:sulfotransferase family protein n=1 Tax=Egicoccus sp. AB-alg2 TaxID=3242693 RepID=UPI00359E19B0